MWPGIINYYASFLPEVKGIEPVTLHEGQTPLIYAPRISAKLQIELYLKFEGANPTGSFKDRGMTMAVTKARSKKVKHLLCASTGNTSASAAAYGARASIKVHVIIPSGNIALGKLSQALIHGARVLPIQGNFDEALELVREIGKRDDFEVVNSLNPLRIEGQKTLSFEICDDLKRSPDYFVLPVGNGGNITACWKGFQEYYAKGLINKTPKLLGVQAAGAAPLVEGRPIKSPKTIATAIQIGNPASWEKVMAAIKESEGLIRKVTDDDILEAYKYLPQNEGIYCEPASAASLAGIMKGIERGDIIRGSLLVAVLTGHGLKDPGITSNLIAMPRPLKPDIDILLEEMNAGGI